MPKLTKEEYISWYCKESRFETRDLDRLGLSPESCNCGKKDCLGWTMVSTGAKVEDSRSALLRGKLVS